MLSVTIRQLIAKDWPEIESGELDDLIDELKVTNPERFQVELQFTTNDRIQKLNREQREKDEVTDILSFPLYSHTELITHESETTVPVLLGTLVVCPNIVRERPHGLSWTLLHGLRHLLGYDHDETGESWFVTTEA